MSEQYRVQDKRNVNLRGRPATSFKLFERNGKAFIFAGNFFRPGGNNASDAQCIAFALHERDAGEFDPIEEQE